MLQKTPPGELYLSIQNLWKAFGSFLALKDISLEINEGEFVCFLGPSGCGKTTLLRAIAGLDLQTKGTVMQDGKDVSNLPPSERDFGIVFQSYALFPNLTIEKNIAFGLENTGRSKSDIAVRVNELLSWLVCRIRARNIRRNCRVVSSNGLRWRVPLRPTPDFCCWTNPCRRWTPKCVFICGTRSRSCSASWV